MSENFVQGTAGGNHVSGKPLTLPLIEQGAPGLLQNTIDERIVKVRPMSTPVDQLSRCSGSRRSGSMTVEYYSVDTKQTETTTSRDIAAGVGRRVGDNIYVHKINTADDTIFEVSETILVPEIKGYDASGKASGPLVLYVTERSSSGLSVAPVNGEVSDAGIAIPAIPAGTRLVRMGRAATELDVQTAQFAALPRKAYNNCQIFKMQVEQTTLAKIARKEVGWNFSDQEEAAVIDMRLGMEKSFIFGSPAKLFDTNKNEYLYLTGGIWNQTDNSFELPVTNLSENNLISLFSKAFTGNNGSKRKILIAGTGLLEAISKLTVSRIVRGTETRMKWGVEFKEMVSNFGTLYLLHSEIFDQCGHRNDGFILDPNYMTKYVHVPFGAEQLDLRTSGQRNTDAVVLTEASCLVLRYPKAHMKVIGKV